MLDKPEKKNQNAPITEEAPVVTKSSAVESETMTLTSSAIIVFSGLSKEDEAFDFDLTLS